MNRSTLVKIGVVIAVAIVVAILGRVADAMLWPDGSEAISGNLNMLVLVGGMGVIASILAKSRQRPVAQADADTRSAALAFRAKPGMAQLIVYRDDKMGAQLGVDILIDDAPYVQLISPRFACIDLAPGSHRIAVDFQGRRAEHTAGTKDGEVLALYVRMKMGLTATNASLEPVSAEQARRAIGGAQMVLPIGPRG